MRFFNALAALPLMQLASAVPLNFTEPGTVPGTTSHYNEVRGKTYHYLLAEPDVEPKGTILLLHGFPDVSNTWRFQIPFLTEIGYKVIAPDLIGYAGTDSPSDIIHWSHKEQATDLANLVGQIVPGEKVIVGGHDWGAGLVYKVGLWYPDLVSGLFTIAVPYMPPWLGLSTEWNDLAELVADGTYPTLGYQLQWRDQSIDRNFTTPSAVRLFLNAGFGGLTPDGRPGFTSEKGLDYDLLPLLEPQTLVSEAELDFLVDSLLQKGFRGAFNWYRTRRIDWEDELPLAQAGDFRFRAPTLFIPAFQDPVFPEHTYENMADHFDRLDIKGVDLTHWAHWDGPDEINALLEDWLATLE